MKTKQIFFSFLLIEMILLTVFYARADTQDDICNIIDSNMTISQCNLIFEIFATNSTTTIFNNNTETTIQNLSLSQSQFNQMLINSNQKFITEDDLEDEFEDFEDDLEINDEYTMNKYERDLDHEYRMAQLQANKTQNNANKEIEKECDYLCQITEKLEMEKKIELLKMQSCALNPSLSICNTKINEENNTKNNDDIMYQLINKIDNLGNEPQETTKNLISKEMIFLIVILCAGGFYFYKQNETKKENKRNWGNPIPVINPQSELNQKSQESINQQEATKTVVKQRKKLQMNIGGTKN